MKILHVGDAHLGKKQYGLTQRQQDFRDTLTQCIDIAIENKVAVIVLPGDIGNTPNLGHTDVLHLKSERDRAVAAGIAVVGIEGNHDMADGNWLRICGITNLDEVDAVIDGVRFCGVGPQVNGYYAEVIQRLARAEGQCDVFVTHQTFAEMCNFETGGEAFGMLSTKQLAQVIPGVKYVAMGDIHDRCIYKEDGITMVYPGSTDMTASNENPNKVVMLVDTADWSVTPIDLKIRQHVEIQITCTADLDVLIEDHKNAPEALFKLEVDPAMESGMKQTRKIVRDNGMLAVVDRMEVVDGDRVIEIDLASWDRAQHSQELALSILQGDELINPAVRDILLAIVKTRGESTHEVINSWYTQNTLPQLEG